MRIRKMLSSCVKLDHALYLINYTNAFCTCEINHNECSTMVFQLYLTTNLSL